MEMTKTKRGWIITAIVVVVVGAAVALFRYTYPGVYMPYTCDLGGDATRKFYGDNFKARGAVCDGLYIPIGAKLNGASYATTLEYMAALIASGYAKPTTMNEMLKLADDATLSKGDLSILATQGKG